jgi:hypothetical protein
MNQKRSNTLVPLLLVALLALSPLTLNGLDAQEPGKQKLEDLIVITFPKKEYTFTLAEVAKGVKFPYRAEVRQDVPGMIPNPQNTGGNKPNDPSGLQPFPVVSGNGQRYCLQDVGLGPPPSQTPRTIKKGKYDYSFSWDGRNWTGPSDFGNPKGKPFPPGTYQFMVSALGRRQTVEGVRQYNIVGNVKVILKD